MPTVGSKIRYFYDDLGEIHFRKGIIKSVHDSYVMLENGDRVLFSEITHVYKEENAYAK